MWNAIRHITSNIPFHFININWLMSELVGIDWLEYFGVEFEIDMLRLNFLIHFVSLYFK